jgi:hypothetical protein
MLKQAIADQNFVRFQTGAKPLSKAINQSHWKRGQTLGDRLAAPIVSIRTDLIVALGHTTMRNGICHKTGSALNSNGSQEATWGYG